VCDSVLQCPAACCSVPIYIKDFLNWSQFCYGAVCCSVLQCVAVCCSVLQCAAICLNEMIGTKVFFNLGKGFWYADTLYFNEGLGFRV